MSAINGPATITFTVSGWRRFFTWTYWRIQIPRLLAGQPPLHIITVFGEITDITVVEQGKEDGKA